MVAYNASDVSLSMRIHTKECASHKSTFTNWVDVASVDKIPKWDTKIDDMMYGDYLREYYNGDILVGKMLIQQGEKTFSVYHKEGIGEKYECDCGMPYTKIEGFAQDKLITIKRED